MKQEPLLADLALREDLRAFVGANTERQLKDKIRRAHHFVLDAQASTRVAEVGRDVPELLIEYQQFARAPYNLMWVEADASVLHRTATGIILNATELMLTDVKVGWLVDHGTVYTFAQGRKRPGYPICGIVPYVYHLHTPWGLEEQLVFAQAFGTSRRGIDQFLWGVKFNSLDADQQRALRERHSCSILYRLCESRLSPFLRGAAGDLRNIISMLLILNRPSMVHYVRDVDSRHSFLRGKVHTFLSHQVVTIHCDARPLIHKIGTSEDSLPRRRHEVRGHWCHNTEARDYARVVGCVHEWVPDPDHLEPASEHDHWVCAACGGKRWWRHEHVRGSAEVGYSDKHYKVTQ